MDPCVHLHWEFSLCIVSAKGLLNKASTKQVKQWHSQLKWRNEQRVPCPAMPRAWCKLRNAQPGMGVLDHCRSHTQKRKGIGTSYWRTMGRGREGKLLEHTMRHPWRQSTLWAQPPLLFQAEMQSVGLNGSYRCSGHYRAAAMGLMPLCKLTNWSLKKLLRIYPRFLEGRIYKCHYQVCQIITVRTKTSTGWWSFS